MSEADPVLPGWFTTGPEPHLIGSRCSACGTYYFPKLETFCRNPACESTQFETVELSRTGKLWSFTDACYTPPEPYIAADPFIPYAIAAVELDREKMIVLGQVVEGVGVDALRAGLPMELVVETIPDAVDPKGKLVWKWKPMEDAR
ncbi:Zn-ribbon domain-containing OB-fold protein [Rhizorhabdus sp. FW153]|uniref:Zn-ribbon domain-containing OB-fold protein n=1 Tax=Rhizorhabdus sp. FW153 TaxID=3400216 RepID=UPI003CEC58D4